MTVEIELKEALQIVLEMALLSILDDQYVAENPDLKPEQERQEAAIKAVRIHMGAQ